MRYLVTLLCAAVFGSCGLPLFGQDLKKADDTIRIASYNVALNRKSAGALSKELESGNSRSAKQIAEVIQRVRPDILLVNELDYDEGKSAKLFLDKYLSVGQDGLKPMDYSHHFVGPVNTGVDSGLDYDNNGRTGEPNDAIGFGYFPGQYGMVVYSKFDIDQDAVRTFQKFRWKDMPDWLAPKKKDGGHYYSEKVIDQFRLSSKSHWDLPIRVGDATIHLLACHPTPPVFDGPEDKNGCRNHDEIRFWVDYVAGRGDYIYDDKGEKGGLEKGAHFVVAGDLNADPVDGDSRDGAVAQLLENKLVNGTVEPKSTGGKHWADSQGGANKRHQGNPLFDTGDFNDRRVGNMRIDYVVPSKNLDVASSGVFWPKPNEPGAKAAMASDHRLVWIDVRK